MTTPDNILLLGVVGSTAYGLNTPESDIDRLGLYAAPTELFHGLYPPVDKQGTVVTTKPDATYHEALKYVRLAMRGNPTVTELMWLDKYEVATPLGQFLINRRQSLLSAKRIRDAYFGYATSQFSRLFNRGDGSFSADTRKRTAKHARHLLRLLDQGFELYSTGHLTIVVDNPQRYFDFGMAVSEFDHTADYWIGAERAKEELHNAELKFDSVRSPLPESPDDGVVEAWLRTVRWHYWKSGAAE